MRSDLFSRMNLCEKDIEDWLFENPEAVVYLGDYSVAKWIGRQFEVPSGIIDLLGVDQHGNIVVVEIKIGAIDGKAITQCARYAGDITRAYDCMGAVGDTASPTVKKLVIGSSIDNTAILECISTDTWWLTFSPRLDMQLFQPGLNRAAQDIFCGKLDKLMRNPVLHAAKEEYSRCNAPWSKPVQTNAAEEIIKQAEAIVEDAFQSAEENEE